MGYQNSEIKYLNRKARAPIPWKLRGSSGVTSLKRILTAICGLLLPTPLAAQGVAPPEVGAAIPLGTGATPDAMGPEIWYGTPGDMSVRDTVEATLLPVLPERAMATGQAVIVAPGGAFMTLSWNHEGTRVAQALAGHGIAAFVLKYRFKPTPRDWPEFGKVMSAQMSSWIGKPGMGLKVETPAYAVEDAIAALRLVRSRAAEWKVDPARIGMIGFSAGGRLTLATVKAASAQDMPSFIAPIYPPMERIEVPANAPPMFVAMASDDPLSGKAGHGLIESWIDAGKSVEFHSFRSGGHGFGLGYRNGTTAGWIDLLANWIHVVAPPQPATTK